MDDRTRERLLARFAAGTLDESEKRSLFESALHDQDLFDELAEEDMLRDLLEPKEAREAALERLRGAAARSRTPRRLAGVLALAAALAAVAVGVRLFSSRELDLVAVARGPEPEAAALWRESDDLPAAKSIDALPASLSMTAPAAFPPGAPLPFTASVGAPAYITLLIVPPDGAPRVVLPREGGASMRVEAGPLPLPAYRVPAVPGTYRLRLVAVPASDPLPPDHAALLLRVAAGEASVADAVFHVTP